MADDQTYQATLKAHGASAKRRSQAIDPVNCQILTGNVLVFRCRREDHREWQTYTIPRIDIVSPTVLRNCLDRLSFSEGASYVYNDGMSNPVVNVDEIMEIFRSKTVLGSGRETMLDIVVFDRDPTMEAPPASLTPVRTSRSSGRPKEAIKKRRCSVQ